MNCIIGIFIFGLVIDYSIFLTAAWQKASGTDDRHLARSSGAVTISALTTIAGLGALVMARHPALHSLGLTALLGISAGLISVLLIIPLFRPRGGDTSPRRADV
jgi:predicted RND superfamily exporter protein